MSNFPHNSRPRSGGTALLTLIAVIRSSFHSSLIRFMTSLTTILLWKYLALRVALLTRAHPTRTP